MDGSSAAREVSGTAAQVLKTIINVPWKAAQLPGMKEKVPWTAAQMPRKVVYAVEGSASPLQHREHADSALREQKRFNSNAEVL